EILNYIPCSKAKNARIIGVTQNDDSVLARESDIYFKIVAEHESDMWDMLASASCNTIATVWDAVAFTVMKYNGYTKEDLKLTHPGGKVGDILKGTK
ncbi:MAG: phosphosugar isomerase, partial [Clostridia bacterium]|nr:phosphosugar isomerase [Clostridia bacterium]